MQTIASLQHQYADHREFYPGDTVIIAPEYYRGWLDEHHRTFTVLHTNEDGSRVITLRHVSSNWMWLPDFGPDQAVLLDRGPLFNYLMDPSARMTFIDASDEAEFWLSLDMAEQVPNHMTGLFVGWTMDQAREALATGLADVVFPEWPAEESEYGFVRGRLAGHAYRFSDRTIGERIRKHAIDRMDQLVPQD